MTRELLLLSPYRLPAQNPLMLSNDDVAAFLNGYSALWHPAVMQGATAPPRIGSPYDYEQPTAGHVYALPESPSLLLPDDWHDRARAAGAVAFQATPDRAATLANLRAAFAAPEFGTEAADPDLWGLDPAQVAPFFGIALGYLVVEALFEAMEHENLLATPDLWQHVQEAVAALPKPDAEAVRRSLQAAADLLLAAREVLYPVTIHVVDLLLLDEQRLDDDWPASFHKGMPLNVVSCASLLEKLGQRNPDLAAALRARLQQEQLEICGGPYIEREDALLPLESQVWNLRKGLATTRELLGQEIQVFGRKRCAAHPQLPLLLNAVGLRRALLVPFDDAVMPTYRVTVVNWSTTEGKQIEGFTRTPYAADNPQTYFNLAHYLHQTIMQDHGATLALLHATGPAAPWYHDLLELTRFAPVLGQWTTLTRYFNEVLAGEYASPASADDFHADYLSERTSAHETEPVSWFARHARLRRRVDTVWTLAALHRGLTGHSDTLRLDTRLAGLEDRVETAAASLGTELADLEKEAAGALAERLVARAPRQEPGYLVLNPCSFARRVALELEGIEQPLPIEGPVKACQIDEAVARLVVEVPALGFAWFPRTGRPGAQPAPRMRLADSKAVRNEFFEAEVDPMTGGLRAIRDHRTRINRLGQQLVFNPGSTMLAKEIKVTSTGPALGEIMSEGALLDQQEQVLALFRQRFRAWAGRPVLDLRIELFPKVGPQGYPWHTYYGARFAWRDERATLLRGLNGPSHITSHTRPETPDYLELRLGRQNTVVLPGGLPFHQRHGARMLDVMLIPEGEKAQLFDLAIGIDRDHPMQTALGMVTPVPLVPTVKGPPHVGATGWLFHLDVTNLLLTSLRPAADGADAIVAHLAECTMQASQPELRCIRDPKRAVLVDALGTPQLDANIQGDAALFEVAPGELLNLRVEFE